MLIELKVNIRWIKYKRDFFWGSKAGRTGPALIVGRSGHSPLSTNTSLSLTTSEQKVHPSIAQHIIIKFLAHEGVQILRWYTKYR